jgi:hypothetical protein
MQITLFGTTSVVHLETRLPTMVAGRHGRLRRRTVRRAVMHKRTVDRLRRQSWRQGIKS